MTQNELEVSKKFASSYYLYRVYDFDINSENVKIKIYQGDLSRFCTNPILFKTSIK